MTTRFWEDAEPKRADGCRVGYHCGYDLCDGPIELAHLAPRRFDEKHWYIGGVLYVHPDNIVPLCRRHHEAFDTHALSLVEFLTSEEQGHVAEVLGLVRALKRVGGEQ